MSLCLKVCVGEVKTNVFTVHTEVNINTVNQKLLPGSFLSLQGELASRLETGGVGDVSQEAC
jgi:hypothetical protein